MTPATQDRISRIVAAAYRTSDRLDPSAFAQIVTLALKEQDRDTRHACAEAVLTLHERETNTSAKAIVREICTQAHQVCMNVQAV